MPDRTANLSLVSGADPLPAPSPSQVTPRRAARLREQLARHRRPLGIAAGALGLASSAAGLLATEHGPALVRAGWEAAQRSWREAACVVAGFVFLVMMRALGAYAESARSSAESNRRLHEHLEHTETRAQQNRQDDRAAMALQQQQVAGLMQQVTSLIAKQNEVLTSQGEVLQGLAGAQENTQVMLERLVERTDRWYPPETGNPQRSGGKG